MDGWMDGWMDGQIHLSGLTLFKSCAQLQTSVVQTQIILTTGGMIKA